MLIIGSTSGIALETAKELSENNLFIINDISLDFSIIKRIGEPNEIANAIEFLLLDNASNFKSSHMSKCI